MLVTNDVIRDSRVLKEAKVLLDEGFSVRVIGLASSEFPSGEYLFQDVPTVLVELGSSRAGNPESRAIKILWALATAPIILLIRLLETVSEIVAFGIVRLASSLRGLMKDVGLRNMGKGRSSFPVIWSQRWTSASLLASRLILSAGRKLYSLLIGLLRLPKVLSRATRLLARRLVGPRLARLILAFRFEKAVREVVGRLSPEIIHAHDFDAAIAGAKHAQKLNAKLVYDSHELWVSRNVPRQGLAVLEAMTKSFEKFVERVILRRAELVITVSDGIAKRLKTSGCEGVKLHVIKNVPALDTNHAGEIGASLVTKGAVYYSGRITQGRLLEFLIEAVAGLPDSLSIHLLGYGPEAYSRSLVELADELSVDLYFHDPVPSNRVAATLSQSQLVFIGVEPLVESYRLSLPNKFFEGALSGRPIVIPNLQEMVAAIEGLDGVHIYSPSSIASLREAILEALSLEFDSEASLSKRMHRYSWADEARTLAHCYEWLQENRVNHRVLSR